MAAVGHCIPSTPLAHGASGSMRSLTALDILRLKASLEAQLLQQQVFPQALPQASLPGLAPPPGLEPTYSAAKTARPEDDLSTCDDSQSDGSPSQTEIPQTTLMIRNVPVLYSRDMLAAELLTEGAESTCDFFYLPYCCGSQRNLSYAFANFTSQAAALIFVKRWQKQRLVHFSSRKPLTISFADVQGLELNLLELKKKRVNRVKFEQCQPLIFAHGRPLPMAEAFEALENETPSVFKALENKTFSSFTAPENENPWTCQAGQIFSL